MRSCVVLLWILKMHLASSQFAQKVCVGSTELAFSDAEKDFNTARVNCKSYGGELVKDGSDEIHNAIKNAITTHRGQYIGAYDGDGDNRFQWLIGGTSVPLIGQSGFQKWISNQPDNGGEKCVTVEPQYSYQWEDVPCSEQHGYICQKDIELTISQTDDIVTCSGTVSGSTTRRWKKNSVDVSSWDPMGVHQAVGAQRTTLYLENAKITDAGEYTCVFTWNCRTEKTYSVSVDGTPTIQKIENSKCSTNLRVTWKPKKSAVGFKHRISATNGTEVTMSVTPTNDSFQSTEISGLEPATQYIIEISVCPDAAVCKDEFAVVSMQETDGNGECKIAERVCGSAEMQIQWVKSRHLLGMGYKLIVLDTSTNAIKNTNVKFLLAEDPTITITKSNSRPGFCSTRSELKISDRWETVIDLIVGYTRSGKLATLAKVQLLKPLPGYKIQIFDLN